MKTKKNIFFIAIIVLFAFVSCNKDDDNDTPSNNVGTNLGTFVGNLQVSNDPQTKLGYIYNAKVTVSTLGTDATIKIVGNEGFDREYTGTVFSSNTLSTFITIKKQTKPVEKIAGNDLQITNNSLAIMMSLANDKVVVKETPTSTTTTEIDGKISMVGTDFLKQ